jgi:hypothetical protein
MIVMIPIVSNAEGDDAQSNEGAVCQHRHVRALIRINNVCRISPAAVRASHHVAPAIVAQATFYDDLDTRQQGCHYGVFRGGSGAKIHLLGNIAHLRQNGRRQNCQRHCDSTQYF